MNKTRLDFQNAAYHLKPKKWIVHHCSFCNYPCGYIFCDNNEYVGYDRGCYCTNRTNIREVSWNNLSDFYNKQTNVDVIKKMDEFWGFKNE